MADIEQGKEFDQIVLEGLSKTARILITTGSNDPSSGGGETAPVGSLFLRQVTASIGEIYFKVGANDVDWELIASNVDVQEIQQKFIDMKEPTGHKLRSETQLSFNEGTRTLTIQPIATDFEYYIHGTKYIVSIATNSVIPDTQGIHYFYLDENENLINTQTFTASILTDYAYTAVVYWDVGSQTATYFGEERHGITMDGFTHQHLHLSIGTQYISGLALNSLNTDVGSPVNTDAWIGVDGGVIRDEDIDINIIHDAGGADPLTINFEQILVAPAQIPVFYRDGANGDWKKKNADDYPLIYSGVSGYTDGVNGLPAWNEWTGATWQLTPVTNNQFLLMHIIATNDLRHPIVAIQGIAEYQNKPAGLDAARVELAQMSGLPFQEFTPIATMIWECRSIYTNTVKARLRTTDNAEDYVDWREIDTFVSTIGGGGLTDHGNLSGLGDDDHIQYVFTQGSIRPIVQINTTPNDYDSFRYNLGGGYWEAKTNSILYRHNGAITQTFNTTPTILLFGTNERTDADYSYSAGTITINTTGTYEITYEASYDSSTNNINTCETSIYVNGSQVIGSRGYSYHSSTTSGAATTTAVSVISLNNTDTVNIRGVRIDGNGSLNTRIEGCRLNIRRL